jgi:hypothetical protein
VIVLARTIERYAGAAAGCADFRTTDSTIAARCPDFAGKRAAGVASTVTIDASAGATLAILGAAA